MRRSAPAARPAISLNFAWSDEGGPLALPVEFEIMDQNGKMLYKNTVMVRASHLVCDRPRDPRRP